MKILFSEQALTLACRFSTIEDSVKNADKPHIFCQLLKNFLKTIESEDPTAVHYDIGRTALNVLNKKALKNEQAVDMLARELVKACLQLDKEIKFPEGFIKLVKRSQTEGSPYLLIVELTNRHNLDELFFPNSGLAIWDSAYLKLLKSFGDVGENQSNKLSKKFLSNNMKWDSQFWFKNQYLENDIHFFHSHAFLGLAHVLWEDVVKNKI